MSAQDKFDAKADQVTGKIKETAGDATDNEQWQAEGRGEQLKGGLKDAAADVKDAAGKAADAVKDAFKK